MPATCSSPASSSTSRGTSSRRIPSPGLRLEVGLRLSKMNPKPDRTKFSSGHFFPGLGSIGTAGGTLTVHQLAGGGVGLLGVSDVQADHAVGTEQQHCHFFHVQQHLCTQWSFLQVLSGSPQLSSEDYQLTSKLILEFSTLALGSVWTVCHFKHRCSEHLEVLVENSAQLSQTKPATRQIELFLHMAESVDRTAQPALSQTSLDLPALNMSRAMLGGLVNISTFFNCSTMNLTRTL